MAGERTMLAALFIQGTKILSQQFSNDLTQYFLGSPKASHQGKIGSFDVKISVLFLNTISPWTIKGAQKGTIKMVFYVINSIELRIKKPR